MDEARKFVDAAMDFDGYGGCTYVLQTKINHEWASGLLVLTDEYCFHEELQLAEAVFQINDWYTRAVKRLKLMLEAAKKEEICA